MKSKTIFGLGAVAALLLWLSNRFTLKVYTPNLQTGNVQIKITDGYNTHNKTYKIDKEVTEQLFGKYKLHVRPELKIRALFVSLYDETGQRIQYQEVSLNNTELNY